MTYFKVFDKQGYLSGDPHGAIVSFIQNWLVIYHGVNVSEKGSKINRGLKALFDETSPGFGLEWDGDICGYYDDEWMPDEGIPEFQTGEAYVVSFDYRDMSYPMVMYSHNELMGWFSLGLQYYGELFPQMKEVIDSLERKYYVPEEVKAELWKKIRGELEWVYGPFGNLSPEMRFQWRLLSGMGIY